MDCRDESARADRDDVTELTEDTTSGIDAGRTFCEPCGSIAMK